MLQLTDALSHMVARRSGVVTIDELLASGNSIDTIRRAVTAKALVRCHSGTYRFATSAPTFEARCIAACLADEEAIVTGPAAACSNRTSRSSRCLTTERRCGPA